LHHKNYHVANTTETFVMQVYFNILIDAVHQTK
jgi:hypothetical protein